jgi:diguanylate cyclase
MKINGSISNGVKINKSLIAVFGIIYIFLAVAYIINEPASFLTETLYLFPVFISAAAGFFAARAYGLKSHNGKALFLIALGLAFWATGELLWYIFKNFMGIDPFPSAADALFLLAYPLLLSGILYGTRLARTKWNQMDKEAAAVGIAVVVILAAAVSYWGIYKAYNPETSLFENIMAMSYGVADLILIGALIFSLGTARAFKGGRFGIFWTLITSGFFFTLSANILFAIYRSPYGEDLKPYMYIDLVWIAGYLLVAYALLDNALSLRAIHKKLK